MTIFFQLRTQARDQFVQLPQAYRKQPGIGGVQRENINQFLMKIMRFVLIQGL